MTNLYEQIKQELLERQKLKGIAPIDAADSSKFHEASLYNEGIMTAIEVLDAHKEELQNIKKMEG